MLTMLLVVVSVSTTASQPGLAIADTTTIQVLETPPTQGTLPAGLSSAQTLGSTAHDASNEFAHVDGDTPQSEDMDVGVNQAAEAQDEAEDDEDEDDDEDDDDGDDGAIGEISERDDEEEDDDDDAAEEDEESIAKIGTPATNGNGSSVPSILNGGESSEQANRKRRESHDVAFDAEMDPDLYGLRRSVCYNLHACLLQEVHVY